MEKLFFHDLETTGVRYWKNGIHQISGVIEIDGVAQEKFNFKVQPYKDAIIEDEALAVGGITREMLAGYAPFNEVYRSLTKILGSYVNKFDKTDKFHLVGYNNASFDNSFFRAFFVQNGDNYFGSWFWADTIDCMVLASNYFRHRRASLPNFKLATVAAALGAEVSEEKLHDAQYDIELTRYIYHKINSNKNG